MLTLSPGCESKTYFKIKFIGLFFIINKFGESSHFISNCLRKEVYI